MPKTDIGVGELVNKISQGELRLPELQRRYRWTATRVRDLFDSLYRNYPSGTILVWETDLAVPARDLAIAQKGAGSNQRLLLLDGQQRLTSLSAVIRGEPIHVKWRARPIEIAFNLDHPEGPPREFEEVDEDDPDLNGAAPDDHEEGGGDIDVARPSSVSVKDRVKHSTFVVASRALLADPHWVRVSEIFDSDVSDYKIISRCEVSPDSEKYELYSRRLQRVRKIRDYQYVMHTLTGDISYEEVAEIFVRVNSLGMKLRGSDLALAQITARWPGSLTLLEEFSEECDQQWRFSFDLGLLVRMLVVFATGQSRFRTVGSIKVETLEESWVRAKAGLRFAANLLRTNAGIEDVSLLSSPFMVIPVAVIGDLRDEQLSSQEERELLHWLFVANATGHYSRGSSESLLDADLSLLFRRDGTPADLLEIVQQQVGRTRFTAADFAGRNTRSPLYATAYLALKHDGARDWKTGLGLSLSHAGRAHAIQAHHIFPKSVMAKRGVDPREINEIANMAFVSAGKNLSISTKTPDVYLPEIVESRGQEALTKHCIPPTEELWNPDRFGEFLEYRRAELAAAVNRFLDGYSAPGGVVIADLASLIDADEGELVEFKQTVRWSVKENKLDKDVERSAVKTVAAFLNSHGGHLVIGVRDSDKEVVGLDPDLAVVKGNNLDGYEQFLRQLFNNTVGPVNSARIAISFATENGHQACIVRVPRSPTPVYVNEANDDFFYIRDGNGTRQLNRAATVQYVSEHFS